MIIKNALATVEFTLNIPEEKLKAICQANNLDMTKDSDYEKIWNAVHEWALDNWIEHLDWMAGAEAEIEVTI